MKRILKVFFTILVLVAWAFYLWRNWRSMAEYEWQFEPISLLAALFLAICYWLGLALCWQRILVASGGTLSIASGIRIWVRSMIARYLPGNLWHVLARLHMAEEEGEPRTAVLVSTTIEQVMTLVGALVVFGIFLPYIPSLPGGYVPMLLMIPLGLLIVHPVVLSRGAALLAKLGVTAKISGFQAYGDAILLLFCYVFVNLLAGMALMLVSVSAGSVSLGQGPAIIGAFGAGWAIGYLSILTPSGIGVREGVLTLILTPILGLPLATAASLFSRVVYTGAELCSFIIVAILTKYLTGRSGKLV